MKKSLFFIIVLCSTPLLSLAQSKEKGLFVEGSIAYSDTHYKHSVFLTPTVGYQFHTRWSAGMKASFETGDLAWQVYTPFIRYAFLQHNNLSLFTEAQWNIWRRNVDGGQSGFSEVGLNFGATYAVSQHFRIIGHYLFLGYSGQDKEGAWLGQNTDFGLDANVQRFQLGVQYIF